MPDRPLRNLTRDRLLGIYEDLQSEPSSKKYNMRKELQTDKRDNVVYANRWLTRDQFLEMAREEILARGLEVPAAAPDARGGVEAGAEAPAAAEPDATTAQDSAVAEGIADPGGASSS